MNGLAPDYAGCFGTSATIFSRVCLARARERQTFET